MATRRIGRSVRANRNVGVATRGTTASWVGRTIHDGCDGANMEILPRSERSCYLYHAEKDERPDAAQQYRSARDTIRYRDIRTFV